MSRTPKGSESRQSQVDFSDGVLDTEQASDHVGVNPGTLRYWRSIKQGPVWFRLGPRKIGYRRTDLDRWLSEQFRASSSRSVSRTG